jgi:hypothetical protein
MKNTLRMVFSLLIIFGAFYLNDGKPKGFYTHAFDFGCVIVGTIGLSVLGIMGLRKKELRKKDDMDPHSKDN